MKFKLFAITAVVSVLLLVNTAQAAMTLKVIGRSPFHQPPLTSVEDLKQMIQTREADVKKGFDLTPQADLFAAFMDQAPVAQVDTVEYQKGSKFQWMLFKKKNSTRIRMVKDVTWGGDKPFSGYQFFIDKDGNRYTFAVPLGCGNIAFVGKAPVPAPTPAPVAVVAPPAKQSPQCGMVVSPLRAFCGEIVTIDATGSTDSDGDIEKMTIAFIDDQGRVVSEKVIDGNVLKAEIPMPAGNNTLKVTVTDNDGLEATSAECTVDVTGMSRVRFLADLGYYRQWDPANHIFGRVGLEYKLNEDFSLLGMIGGAPHVHGIDGKSAFMIDALAEYNVSRYFIDFGVGGWITDGDDDIAAENSQLDLVAIAGARVYGEPDEFNASLFVEVRSGVEELDEMAEYGRFGVGVRFRF